LAYFGELSSIALAHLSQYFSNITAPSVLYLTKLVAGSPHPTQNLEFFSLLDIRGSILFSVFSNKSFLLYLCRKDVWMLRLKMRVNKRPDLLCSFVLFYCWLYGRSERPVQ